MHVDESGQHEAVAQVQEPDCIFVRVWDSRLRIHETVMNRRDHAVVYDEGLGVGRGFTRYGE